MTARGKKWVIIAGSVLCVLVALCLWVVPRLVDVDRYRPQVEVFIEQKTGKPAHIGHLELTLFPHLAIRVNNFVLENPQGFPAGDFLNARLIYAVLDASALWDRKIVFRSLLVEDPVIHLLSGPGGHWNFENPPHKVSGITAPSKSQPPVFSLGKISQITLDGGVVTVANLLPSRQAGPTYFGARGISCDFKDVNLSAATASTAPLAMVNRIRPVLPVVLGAPTVAYGEDNSPQPIAHGSFKANSLRFGAFQATSVNSQVYVFPRQAFLDNLNLNLAGGLAKGKAAFDFSGQNLRYDIRTVFHNIDVAQLVQAFPNARGKMTGTMQGNFDVQGEASHSANPLSGLVGTGQVIIRNGKLPSLQINRNLLMLARFAGLGSSSGDPAAFSLISADLNITNQVLTSRNVKIVSSDVDVNAAGTLALEGPGQMNYAGVARLTARQTGLTDLLANISGATFSNGKLSFPFDLRGTLENPKFALKSTRGALGDLPNSQGTLNASPGSQRSSPSNLIQDLTNRFQKKKTPTQSPQP